MRRLNQPTPDKNGKCNEARPEKEVEGAEKAPLAGEKISFAKWAHPIDEDSGYVEPPWIWPEGTAWHVLDQWTQQTVDAQRTVLGRTPCYRKLNPLS